MRNLKTVSFEETTLPSGLPLTATAWDASNNSIICAFGPTPTSPIIELRRKAHRTGSEEHKDTDFNALFEKITCWDAPCPLPDLGCDEILLLQHFADTGTTCLVLTGGDLIVVREDPLLDQEKIEIVGSVDGGIAAAAWAPDEELLAIVTRADTLILMSRDFEPVTEVTLTPDDLKASKNVSVGWGRKETQFHGKRAKALRDPTMPEAVDEGKLTSFDDARTSISWRGDGAFFAVNRIVLGDRRVVRFFTREATLDSASEPVDGLESALSWRPSGNLVAGIQRLADRVDVVFFERNGLRHGQFTLRLSKTDLESWAANISLAWNVDSTVLAVLFKDRAQFWTMGNYHYYLKQEIHALGEEVSSRALTLRWHMEQSLRFSLDACGSLLDLEFCFICCRGSTVRPNDHGSVAVIDGGTLKLTPLRYANVPPPMSFCDVEVGDNIVDCAISWSGKHIAILTRYALEIHEWEAQTTASATLDSQTTATKNQQLLRPISRTRLISKQQLPKAEKTSGIRYTQLKIRGDHELYVFAPSQCGQPASLLRYVLGESSSVKGCSSTQTPTSLSVPIEAQGTLVDIENTNIWSQSSQKTFALEESHETQRSAEAISPLPGDEPQSEIVRIPLKTTNCKISISRRWELFANRRLLARGCTSFLVTDQHLIFTTSQHYLKFIHLTDIDQLQVPPDTPEIDERCRSIERGAILVTVIPSNYAVVLQMPRGNLETIFPRVLVLAGIRRHLFEQDYRAAFVACQNHQVDLNILHDYRPDIFMANIGLFIDSVKKISRVDEFLSKLKEEDVSQTMYKDTLAAPNQDEVDQIANATLTNGSAVPNTSTGAVAATSKVNRICEAFIPLLEQKGPVRLRNLITAYVSKRPSNLISALAIISSLRKSDTKAADAAVSHLVFLTDATRLYNVSLSTYDLEMTVLVAQHAQMDPREYLPFLEQLHTLEPLRRQFEIDDHLRNYAKALTSLHGLGANEEVEQYTVRHVLYTTALDLYKYTPTHLKSMTALYATYLQSQSRYLDAAIAFESLGDHASAYQSHALAHHWREALACATLVPLEPDQLRSLASSLTTTLIEENRDYRSAATIQIDYLQDVVGASRTLCKGSYFAEAARILALHNAATKLSEIVDAGLAEKFGEITELLADCKGQLHSQIPRIKDLRQKKAEDPLAFYGGDPVILDGGKDDIPDNVSLAPTDASTTGGHSLFTRYGSDASKFGGTVMSNVSRKTSKTKRREERKRARGKKGSVYEEEYLVASVGRLIDRLNGVQEEVTRLVEGMLRRAMRERARDVNEKMLELFCLCRWAKEEVWPMEVPDPATSVDQNYDVNGRGRPNGADGVLWDSKMEGQVKREAPMIKQWKTTGLLDTATQNGPRLV